MDQLPTELQQAEDQRTLTVQAIIESIDKAKDIKPSHSRNSDKVFLLGETGTGKSTLINILIAENLSVIKNKRKFLIQLDDPGARDHPIISEGKLSETKFPARWIDGENDMEYWDLPGFADASGPCHDIPQAYYINTALNLYERIKILVLVREEIILEGRATRFLEIIDYLVPIFENVKDLKDSLYLIITKSEADNQEIVEEMRDVLNKFPDLPDQQRRIIEAMCDESCIISTFEKPVEVGPLQTSIREEIVRNLKRIKPFSSLSPQVSIPNSSKVFMGMLHTHFILNMKSKISKMIALVQSKLQRAEKYKDLKAHALRLGTTFEKISQANGQKDFMTQLSNLMNLFIPDHEEMIEDIANNLRYIEFSRQALPESETDLDPLTKEFQEAAFRLHKLIDMQYDKAGRTVTVKGIFLSLEEILANLTQVHMIENLDIFCYNTLFLDSSVNLPQVNLTIVAPVWKVCSFTNINLSGREGLSPLNHFEIHGSPGCPGGNGGDFTGIGKHFINTKNLKINLDGGKGGKGGRGSDGEDGKDGSDGDIDKVSNRDKSVFDERVKAGWKDGKALFIFESLLTFNDTFYTTYRSPGQRGSDGTDAGMGGCGGHGGRPGKMRLIGGDEEVHLEVSSEEGVKGNNGEAGFPGKGGRGGKTYYGTYQESKAFPSLRGYGKPGGIGTTAPLVVPAQEVIKNTIIMSSKETLKSSVGQFMKTTVAEATKAAGGQLGKKAAKKLAARLVQETVEALGEEALKSFGGEFIKQTITKSLTEALPNMASAAVQNAVGSATSGLVKTAATAGKGAWTVGSMAKSLGINLLIQGGISAVYEVARKKWSEPVTSKFKKSGEDGKRPCEKNSKGLEEPLAKSGEVDLKIIWKEYNACIEQIRESLHIGKDQLDMHYIIEMNEVFSKV